MPGKFTIDEMNYLRANSSKQSIEEMAKVLKRSIRSVRDVVTREGMPTVLNDRQPDSISRADMKNILKKKSFYNQVKNQLSYEELVYFEDLWLDAVQQFDMDIRPTEELQLKRLLLLDIHADRLNIKKKEETLDIAKKQELLNIELGKPSDERDRDIIQMLQNEIAALRSSIQSSSREAKDLISESKHIQKDLKATRDQRADTIDDSKMNFVSWLKVIQETKFRKGVSSEMEVLKLVQKKAKDKLGEYIEFADHTVERQLLNHETVIRNEDNEQASDS